MEPNIWQRWVQSLQGIGQAGLGFSTSEYDRERFQRILQIAAEMLCHGSGIDHRKAEELILEDKGYRTPKVDVRGAVFRGEQILLVREKTDQLWTLPGGWAEPGEPPSRSIEREIEEESGLKTKAIKLLAVHDNNYRQPGQLYHAYKMFFLCEECDGELQESNETELPGFFGRKDIPPLSTNRTTRDQIELCFRHLKAPNIPTEFD